MSHFISGALLVSVLMILLRLELAAPVHPWGHLVINILGLGVIWDISFINVRKCFAFFVFVGEYKKSYKETKCKNYEKKNLPRLSSFENVRCSDRSDRVLGEFMELHGNSDNVF